MNSSDHGCKLFLLDCNVLIEVMKEEGVKPDLIICDPPYDITSSNSKKIDVISSNDNRGKIYQEEYSKTYADLQNDNLLSSYDMSLFSKLVCDLQGKDINIYFFCNKKQIPMYFELYVSKLKCKFNILFWNKPNALPTYYNKYLNDCEYLLHFYKGRARITPECYDDAKTYFVSPINIADKKKWGHPTIKPVELVEKIIRNSTKEGDLVLDPFMGSGTTGVACVHTKRKFIGCEILEKYYNVAQKRIGEADENVFKISRSNL